MGITSSRRALLARGAAAALSCQPSVLRAASGGTGAPRLGRGVNLHHLLSWPAVTGDPSAPGYAWPPFADPAHAPGQLRAMRALGFDFVRITVSPGILLTADGARRARLAAVIGDRLARARAAGLNTVLDLHPVAQDPRFTPERLVDAGAPEAFDAYVETVAWLAGVLDALPHRGTVFEPFNEPPLPDARDAPRWQGMMERLHRAARGAAPSLPLVVTGAAWGGAEALTRMDAAPFRASDVFYTFHYYLPHLFTHQGVPSQYSRHVRGLGWPPRPGTRDRVVERSIAAVRADPGLDEAGRIAAGARTTGLIDGYYLSGPTVEQVAADFADVAAWAARCGVPRHRILLGEFGAARFDGMDAEQLRDRALWLSTVRTAAERQGFGWAYWSYLGSSGMSLADTVTRAPYRPDLAALGLDAPGVGPAR